MLYYLQLTNYKITLLLCTFYTGLIANEKPRFEQGLKRVIINKLKWIESVKYIILLNFPAIHRRPIYLEINVSISSKHALGSKKVTRSSTKIKALNKYTMFFTQIGDVPRNFVSFYNEEEANLQRLKNVKPAIVVDHTENLETLDNNMEARPHKVRIFVSAPDEDPPRNSAVLVNKGKASVQQIFTTALGLSLIHI